MTASVKQAFGRVNKIHCFAYLARADIDLIGNLSVESELDFEPRQANFIITTNNVLHQLWQISG